MFIHYHQMAFLPVRTGTSQPHGHHVHRQIFNYDLMDINKAEQQVEISRYLTYSLFYISPISQNILYDNRKADAPV